MYVHAWKVLDLGRAEMPQALVENVAQSLLNGTEAYRKA